MLPLGFKKWEQQRKLLTGEISTKDDILTVQDKQQANKGYKLRKLFEWIR